MPLYDVKTTEFVVVLRSERIGTNRFILPWIGSCPGWRNGSALASKARGLGSIPFKVCSDAKERVGCRKQWEATAPIHP